MARRMSRERRYRFSRREWAAAREATFRRAGYRCQSPGCGRAGGLEADHIRPIHWGGAILEGDNLQALCRSCHISKTRAEFTKIPRDTEKRATADRLVAELVKG